MSPSRTSWRPQQNARKSSRRLLIATASIPVIAIAAFLIKLVLSSAAAPVQLVILSPPSPDTQAIFPTATATNLSEKTVAEIFNPQHQPELLQPIRCSSESELRRNLQSLADPAKFSSQLLIYASVRPRTRVDDSKVVLDFCFGDAATIPAKDLFSDLAKACNARSGDTRSAVILLDLLDLHVGLEGGISARDAISLIKSAVEPHKQQLAIICSCSEGQRSWELPQTNSTAPPTPPASEPPLVVAPETAFCAAVAKTLLNGHTESAKDFHLKLTQSVQTSVANAWRQTQTPSPIIGNQNAPLFGSLRLRSRLTLPATTPAIADKSPAATTTPSTPTDTPADSTASPGLAPSAAIAAHWSSLENLSSTATQLYPARILKLRADLLRLSLAVNSGHTDNFTTLSKLIGDTIAQLNDEVKDQLNPTRITTEAAAFAASVNAPAPSPQELDAARRFIDSLARPEPTAQPAPLPPSLQVISVTLWSEFANRTDPQTLERLHHFFSRFPAADWPSGRIPWQLTLLHNTLRSASSSPLETQTQLLRSAAEIRSLRENTLLLLAGFSPNPNAPDTSTPAPTAVRISAYIRTTLNSDESHGLNRILNQLTAAESWLAAGQLGVTQTRVLINAAQSNYNSTLKQLDLLNAIGKRRWFQKSSLPAIVQAAALRLERRKFSKNEFELLKKLVNSEADSTVGDPLLLALLHLTAPLQSPSAPASDSQYDSALSTLTNFVAGTDGNAALTAADLSELAAIPYSAELPAEKRPTWSQLRDKILAASPDSNSTTNGNSPDTGSQHTGLWVAFWSLRLLEAASGKPSAPAQDAFAELFSSIDRRIQRKPSPSETTPEILRANLFHILAREWQQLASQPSPDSIVLPSDEQLEIDFRTAINSQLPLSTLRADWTSPTIPDFIGHASPLSAAFTLAAPSQVFINPDQSAACELAVPAGVPDSTRFLINCNNWKLLSPQPVNIEADQDGWFEIPPRSSWPDQNKLTLQLQPLQPLPSTWPGSACQVAAVNVDRVVSLIAIQIQARPETRWQLATAPNSPQLLPESISNPYAPVWLLNLPPETAPDKPLELPFNLQQSAGPAVSKIRLQLLRLSAARQPDQPLPGWEQPVAFNLTAGQPLSLPLNPPAAPPTASPAPAATSQPPATPQPPASAISLNHGFCVRVFPEIPDVPSDQPDASPSSLLTVIFRLPEFSQLVDVTAPSFDPVTRRLSFSLRSIAPNTAGPVRAELHLSPELHHAIIARKLSTQKISPVAFDSPDALAIRNAPPIPPVPDIAAAPGFLLEFPEEQDFSGIFSISAAGFPFARAWKLSHDSTSVEPLDIPESEPESRLQLEVLSSSTLPAATWPELVFRDPVATDGKPAVLRVGVHLHEIKLEPAAETRLRWNLQQTTPVKRIIRASKPENEPIYDIWNRRVDASPAQAPAAAWNLACTTTVLTPLEIPLTELDAGSAKYEVTFTLERRNAPDLTALLPFTIDRAQPREAIISLPAILDPDADPPPVYTLDRIADLDSRILKVEAGLDPQKLRIIWPQPNSRLDEAAPPKLDISSLLRPESLPPVAPGLELPATLHIKLTDAAGNVRSQEKIFRIAAGIKNVPLGEAPPASITVEIAPNIKGKFVIKLVQAGLTQEASSSKPARFENLDARKYTVEYAPVDQKLSGNYVGSKTLVLAPTPPPPPPAPGTPPQTPPPLPPGTIPPQKFIIGK